METDHIEEFRRVADLGSFTLAARELHMTQSALSKHVAALEREFGVDLFTRDKNGISLTPAGKILYFQAVNFTRFLSNLRIQLSEEANHELTDDTASFAPIRSDYLPIKQSKHIPSAKIRQRCHGLRATYDLTTDETCTLILFLEDAGFDTIQHELGFSRDEVADTLVSVYRKLGVTNKAQALKLVLEK